MVEQIREKQAAVAQLGERVTEDHEVAGSNPAGGTILLQNYDRAVPHIVDCRGKHMENESLDEILIDIRSTEMSMMEVLSRIDQYKQDPRYQNYEIFLDGDRYAIVARPKVRNNGL